MIARSKILAAALGLVFAAGTIANASATTSQSVASQGKPAVARTLAGQAKPASHKIAGKHHRVHIARHKGQSTKIAHSGGKHGKLAHRTGKSAKTAQKLGKTHAASRAGKAGLQKNAMNHTKATAVR